MHETNCSLVCEILINLFNELKELNNMKVTAKCVLFWLITILIFSPTNAGWAQGSFSFPKKILYNESINGNIVGRCEIAFKSGIKIDNKELYWLKMSNFQGVGYISTDEVHTYIFPNKLTIFASLLKQSDLLVQEYRLREYDEIQKRLGLSKTNDSRLIFKERNKTIETELYPNPLNKLVDLLSSFIVVSEKAVVRNKYDEKLEFYTHAIKGIRTVALTYQGLATALFMGQTLATEVWSIKYSDVELLRFNIFNDNGFAFPVKVSIKDDNDSIVLRADKVMK
ncbi:MAG: hypothetical protein GY749_49300 [Desulfobacteraceae bacterium]|nr:hypothetical protein [Desulfobacteraceae bacterium]